MPHLLLNVPPLIHHLDGAAVCTDCEHLIRKMLVLEPSKRLTVEQVKRHRWLQPGLPRSLATPPQDRQAARKGDLNDQVLRLMHSLGIDPARTKEVGTCSWGAKGGSRTRQVVSADVGDPERKNEKESDRKVEKDSKQ